MCAPPARAHTKIMLCFAWCHLPLTHAHKAQTTRSHKNFSPGVAKPVRRACVRTLHTHQSLCSHHRLHTPALHVRARITKRLRGGGGGAFCPWCFCPALHQRSLSSSRGAFFCARAHVCVCPFSNTLSGCLCAFVLRARGATRPAKVRVQHAKLFFMCVLFSSSNGRERKGSCARAGCVTAARG